MRYAGRHAMLLWILSLTLLGGVLSALLAGLLAWVPARMRTRVLPALVSYALGTMLAVLCLELLPRLYHDHAATPGIGLALLGALALFFLLEKGVRGWRGVQGAGPAPAGVLILVGDGVHSLVDGVLIASAALADPMLGLVTALAVFAHEVPQEVSDIIVLLHSGFSARRTFAYNALANLATVAGGMGAALTFGAVGPLVPYALAVAAGSFLYVALADLVPTLHAQRGRRAALGQIVLIALGVATVLALRPLVDAPLGHAH